MKKIFQTLFQRLVIVGLLILVQLALLLTMIVWFDRYFVYFYAICVLVSIGAALYILSAKTNPAYKIAWLIPILLFPVFGGLFYLMFGGGKLTRGERRRMRAIADNFSSWDWRNPRILEELEQKDRAAANQSRYIQEYAWSPLYKNTSVQYFRLGEEMFAAMCQELEKAEHYIFLEYFIIQEGKMWNPILEILTRKAKEGVDVRVMYDDLGCIMTLPDGYFRTLRERGIQCQVFNPFIPVLSLRFNNRDHRKICVIDGHTGFTGGINLADEYINAYEKHGHWKDTAVMLKGEGVRGLTMMFLSLWDYISKDREDYDQFLVSRYQKEPVQAPGYVQPYTDSPLDDEAVGETVYLNLINKAQRYVYITTPYLIISNEMVTALCSAAKGGVDVRIVTPHIADKWYVHAVTRAYYEILVEAGVKIYEYTPGFIHAKTLISDDDYGVVGTINLDYRSLYLHFECAVWMYQTPCLEDMKEDYAHLMEVSQPVTLEECRSVNWLVKIGRSILRVFAPLM